MYGLMVVIKLGFLRYDLYDYCICVYSARNILH